MNDFFTNSSQNTYPNSDISNDNLETAIIAPPITYQKRQTRRWLALFLGMTQLGLLMAIGWLGYKHFQLQKQLTEQKQLIQTLTSQIHDVDDKLVNLDHPVKITNNDTTPTQDNNHKNQLEVLKVQLQTADMLLAKADYPAVKNLLAVIGYQLNQADNGITPAMRLTLTNSLQQDEQLITKLQTQPNIWQRQSLELVEIQKFLQKKHADYQQGAPQKATLTNTPLTYAQAQLFEMLTTLNFALQACQNQQSDLYLTYTNQLAQQANALTPSNNLLTANDISQLQEKIKQLNEQLPTTPRLQTGQILLNQIQPLPTPNTVTTTSEMKIPSSPNTN